MDVRGEGGSGDVQQQPKIPPMASAAGSAMIEGGRELEVQGRERTLVALSAGSPYIYMLPTGKAINTRAVYIAWL
jgi:hypothetical protein